MVQSKSSDGLDRRCGLSHCKGINSLGRGDEPQALDFRPSYCSECDLRPSCSFGGDKRQDGQFRQFSLEKDGAETSAHTKVVPRETTHTVVYKRIHKHTCKHDSCSKEEPELVPDRKEPSAPMLNDDSIYTSRQGSYSQLS